MILMIRKAKHRLALLRSKGSVLLLALFVMGAMMIVALGMSTLAINQIRQSLDIKKSTVAFYAAEGGSEEGLYHLRKNYQDINDFANLPWLNGEEFFIEADYSAAGFNLEEKVYDYLKVNEIVSLDLYDEDSLAGSNIRYLSLNWTGKPASWLEVTWQDLQGTSPFGLSGAIQKKFISWDVYSGNYILDLLSTNLHSVQIKALYDEVKNLTIKACADPSCLTEISIPSRLYLTSTGEYPAGSGGLAKAQQKISVSLPEKTPLSPLFDYVMFSEEKLEKTTIFTGSNRAQLIYQTCGPFIIYPDCFYTFFDPPVIERIIVENVGVLDGTITDISLESPVYSITTGDNQCRVDSILTYGQTCNIWINVISSPGATAVLSLSYTPAGPGYSPVEILLKQQRSR